MDLHAQPKYMYMVWIYWTIYTQKHNNYTFTPKKPYGDLHVCLSISKSLCNSSIYDYISVTHRCHKKKSTGCYSFNLTDKGLDPDAVTSVELWIYKQQDLNDHYIQVHYILLTYVLFYHGRSTVFVAKRSCVRIPTAA